MKSSASGRGRGDLRFLLAGRLRARAGEDPEAAAARHALDGDHGQAARGDRGRAHVRARRQCSRRRLRDARGDLDDVGRALLGRRDAGAHLQPEDPARSSRSTGSASRRPGRRPSSSGARDSTYPPEDGPLSAVTPGTPGALITMLAEFGTLSLAEVLAPSIALADGYAIDAETADRIEVEKAKIKAVAVLEGRDAAARRRGARGAGRGRDLPPGRSRGDAAQAGRGGSGSTQGRQVAQGSAAGRLRPLLPRRRRRGIRARRARAGRAGHEGGPRELAGQARGAAPHELPRHRRLQARPLDPGPGNAAGAQHPRELRPEGDGLQQRDTTSTRCTRR